MTPPLRIFLGFDSKEPITFAVAMHSILKRASRSISVTPLVQSALRAERIYTRERNPTESTEFSITRFLCPALCDFEGYSLFLDSDVLVRCDIWDVLLYALAEPEKAVHVVQHEYVPKDALKFDGHVQTIYPKKNWSSVMLFNNARCSRLTPAYVNSATGLDLHRFEWLRNTEGETEAAEYRAGKMAGAPVYSWATVDQQIGALPLDWNWLVGEYALKPDARLLHYTLGAPCFPDYRHGDHADLWLAEYAEMLTPGKPMDTSITTWRDKYGDLFKEPSGISEVNLEAR